MRCEHEHDDGAYVLGALPPVERTAYERHLATCSFCREAMADIAVLPGLLGRLDPAEFAKLLDPSLSAPPRTPAPDPVDTVRTTRRRDRNRWAALWSAAAAVLTLIAGFVFATRDDPAAPPGPTVAMVPVDGQVPVTATITLVGATGGTTVDLVCFYHRVDPSSKPYTVRLMAYGPDDDGEQLGSWVAAPGTEFSMSGVSHFTSLSRLELVRDDGRALLAYDAP